MSFNFGVPAANLDKCSQCRADERIIIVLHYSTTVHICTLRQSGHAALSAVHLTDQQWQELVISQVRVSSPSQQMSNDIWMGSAAAEQIRTLQQERCRMLA